MFSSHTKLVTAACFESFSYANLSALSISQKDASFVTLVRYLSGTCEILFITANKYSEKRRSIETFPVFSAYVSGDGPTGIEYVDSGMSIAEFLIYAVENSIFCLILQVIQKRSFNPSPRNLTF